MNQEYIVSKEKIVKINKSTLFLTMLFTGALVMLEGCSHTVRVMGKVSQTPAEYAKAIESLEHEDRALQQKYAKVIEHLNKVSNQCYQFTVSAKGNGKEVYKDKYTGKVTKLTQKNVIFTLQHDRVSGDDYVYAHNDKPDGGMWDFGIIFDKTSETVTTAKMYIPYGLMRKRINAVVDAVEGKYGDGCPPEILKY